MVKILLLVALALDAIGILLVRKDTWVSDVLMFVSCLIIGYLIWTVLP